MRTKHLTHRGFTLIELVVVIVILGIIGTIATRQMLASIDDARFQQTRQELEQLKYAITGNPAAIADGARSDFGYLGDIGALPPTLNALVENPGGYVTWDGPYVDIGAGAGGHLTDAWGVPYEYSGLTIRSTGSGSALEIALAPSSTLLLGNTVSGVITDADNQPPGISYRDSLRVLLTCPNGGGATLSAVSTPAPDGSFTFANIPIGNHPLRVISLPRADTLTTPVSVPPGSHIRLNILFPADLF